jgi:hypothetical protein
MHADLSKARPAARALLSIWERAPPAPPAPPTPPTSPAPPTPGPPSASSTPLSVDDWRALLGTLGVPTLPAADEEPAAATLLHVALAVDWPRALAAAAGALTYAFVLRAAPKDLHERALEMRRRAARGLARGSASRGRGRCSRARGR